MSVPGEFPPGSQAGAVTGLHPKAAALAIHSDNSSFFSASGRLADDHRNQDHEERGLPFAWSNCVSAPVASGARRHLSELTN